MSNVSHGKDNQANIDFIHNKQKYSISPLICYDIAFGNTVRKSNISSNFIINISNDTWFGNSIGPYHHLSISRVRALENNKWVIRATNDGFSAVISNKGTIVDKLDKGISGVLNSSIDTVYEPPTPYTTGGYFIPYYLALMLVLISVIVNLCIKRRS
jgi:apolipoprotein N-acyltransferase